MGLIEAFMDLFVPETETYSTTKDGTKYTMTKKGEMEFFKVDGLVYSQLDRKAIYTHSYHDKFLPLPLLYDAPKILIIGLGAGTVPFQLSQLYHKKIHVDVVEMNPYYVELTNKFLPKGSADFRVIIGRGEEFVAKQSNKYDIIIEDAFFNGHVPEPFLEEKFISDAYKALTPEGILAINYAPEVIYLPIYIHNLRKRFRHVYRIQHISLGNYILICSKTLDKKGIIEKLSSMIGEDKESRKLLKAYKSMG